MLPGAIAVIFGFDFYFLPPCGQKITLNTFDNPALTT